MNLSAFCAEYRRAVEQTKPWLFRAQLRVREDPSSKEDYGYALEQLLVRRDRAVEEAESRKLVDVVAQIRAIDSRLLDDANNIREVLGVDVCRFLAEPSSDGPRP